MLIQFAVENFLSFREKVVLSMRAAPTVTRASDTPDVAAGTDVLRCAAIYGANASGKSNLVAAIDFARELVCVGVKEKRRIGVRPFRLDAGSKQVPSQFEFYVRAASGRVYGYGFGVTRERVVHEWLSELRDGEESQLFGRDATGFSASVELSGARPDAAERLGFLAQATRENQLLLRTAGELKLMGLPEPLREVIAWFEDALVVVTPDSSYGGLVPEIDRSPEFRDFVSAMLARADTGISAVRARRRELRDDERLSPAVDHEDVVPLRDYPKDRVWLVRDGEDRRHRVDLRFSHPGDADAAAELGLAEESDGTVRFLDLLPILYRDDDDDALRVYVIDELDRSLHTLLARWLIEQFLLRKAQGRSQLVFTTHDTNLLDLQLLRPDSVWFTQKDRQGASTLYSLAEYKDDQLAQLCGNLEQGYLSGRFGAIPFLADPARLGWPPKERP